MKTTALIIIACLIFTGTAFADSPSPPTVTVKLKAEPYAGQSFNNEEPSLIYAKIIDPILSETVEDLFLEKNGATTNTRLKLFKNYAIAFGYMDEQGTVTTRLTRNIKVRSNNQIVTLKVPGSALIEWKVKLSEYLPNRGKIPVQGTFCVQLTQPDDPTAPAYQKCGAHEIIFNVRPAVYKIQISDGG